MASDFDVDEVVDELHPSFNIAPTHDVAAIVKRENKKLVAMRWGLIPSWAENPSIGSKLINARAESLMTRSAFKNAFRERRCLVLADGFYEWRTQGTTKTPLFIHLKSDQSFAFAGLYEIWNSPLGPPVVSCSIVTTEPNDLVSGIHNRMPVILPREVEDFWLDTEVEDTQRLLDVLKPYPGDRMSAYVVSDLVNSVKNDSPQLVEPAPSPRQGSLF